jgi:hypothetical protein
MRRAVVREDSDGVLARIEGKIGARTQLRFISLILGNQRGAEEAVGSWR